MIIGMVAGFVLHNDIFLGSKVNAADRCGDGVCSVQERKPNSYCRKDCGSGARKGWCGNGFCELNENCDTCPGDCGGCTHGSDKENAVCGDSVCSIHESCSKCPEDCGRCSKSFIWRTAYKLRRAMRLVSYYVGKGFKFVGKFKDIDEAVAYIEERKEQIHENAVQRSDAAQELLAFLDEYDHLDKNISEFDKSLMVKISDDGETAGFTNIVPAKRITYSIKKIVKKEQKEVINIANSLMEDPVLRAELAGNTYMEEQVEKASNSMYSGIGKIYSSVTFWKDPSEKASDLISDEGDEEISEAINSNDLSAQKKAIREFMNSQLKDMESVLEYAGEDEESSFDLFLSVWQKDLEEAKTKMDVVDLVSSMNERIKRVENKARENRGWLRRTVYPIQDFLGKSV